MSRERHGYGIRFYLPGMFCRNGEKGRYAAVSITGGNCLLGCKHCAGTLLKTMPGAISGAELYQFGRMRAHAGDIGLLITGGCDVEGGLPWSEFGPAIGQLKRDYNLHVSVHCGAVDYETAWLLKQAGVDQALIDIVPDKNTLKDIYNLKTLRPIEMTLDALASQQIPIVPHIIYGLYFGKMSGEREAVRILQNYSIPKYIIVVFMPLKGTPMEATEPPPPEEVVEFIAWARMQLPDVPAGLGCARMRGRYGRSLEQLAIKAGVNSIAVYSDEAIEYAKGLGLKPSFAQTCCSVD